MRIAVRIEVRIAGTDDTTARRPAVHIGEGQGVRIGAVRMA